RSTSPCCSARGPQATARRWTWARPSTFSIRAPIPTTRAWRPRNASIAHGCAKPWSAMASRITRWSGGTTRSGWSRDRRSTTMSRFAERTRPCGRGRSADLLEGVGVAELLDLAARLAERGQVLFELLAGEGGVLLAGTSGPAKDGAVVALSRWGHHMSLGVEPRGSIAWPL